MITVALGTALLAVPLMAQSRAAATLDLGIARMRFADSLDATALSLTPALQIGAPQLLLRAFANLARLNGGWSNSGTLSGSWTMATAGLLSGELEGTGGGSSHSDGTHTAQIMAFARVHAASASRGVWAGAGMGQTRDIVSRRVRQGDIGAWVATGASTVAASVAPTMVGDTIRYMDSYVAAHRGQERWEVDGSLGVRSGNQLPTLPANRRVWGSAGAILWAAPGIGLVARAGTYPVDFTQGFPGGRFATLGVRLRAEPTAAVVGPPRELPRVDGVRRFEVSPAPDSRESHRIRVYAPAARSIDIMADFTSWSPTPLRSDGRGWWTATLPIASGVHQVNVRIDGGAWGVPPGLTSFKDEFGGVVGLLSIE